MATPYLIIFASMTIHICGGYKRLLDCLTTFQHLRSTNHCLEFRISKKRHQVLNTPVASCGILWHPMASCGILWSCLLNFCSAVIPPEVFRQEGLLEPPDSSGGFRFDSTCNDVKRRGCNVSKLRKKKLTNMIYCKI